MHGDSRVSLVFHRADHGADAGIYIELVSDAASRHQVHGITDQELKLRVAGHRAEHRHAEFSLYGILRQTVEEREILCIRRKFPIHRQVGKALVHDADDVGRLDRISRFHRGRRLLVLLFFASHIFFIDLLDLRLGIALRSFLYQIF